MNFPSRKFDSCYTILVNGITTCKGSFMRVFLVVTNTVVPLERKLFSSPEIIRFPKRVVTVNRFRGAENKIKEFT